MAAVVLTFRRPRLATQVVRGLLEVEGLAPSHVVVVVNGEGGLDDPALEAQVAIVRLPANLGPAGGFRAGLLEALRIPGVRWMYLCEDDVGLFDLPSPRVGALVARVEALEDATIGAVVAYGRDRRGCGGHTLPHRVSGPHGFEEVDAAAWGATLVARAALDAGVLPDPAYFFGYEDFDFCYQLRAAGYRILVDREAAGAGRETAAGRAQAFAGQRPNDRDEPWRAYYTARNYFRLARRHGTPQWALAHLAYSARRYQLAASAAERSAILHGLADGLRGRTGKDLRFERQVGEQGGSVGPGDSPPAPAPTRPVGRRVLHVLPSDAARGAQVFARDLRAALDRPGEQHLLLTIFDAGQAILEPDVRLDIPLGRLRAAGADPRALVRLRSALRELAPDVVVAHGGEPLKYLAPLADGRFALVYYAIGTVTAAARSGRRADLYRWLLQRCDAVAGVSAETLEEATAVFGVRPDREVLLPNGRDPSVFHPAAGAGEDRGAPVTLAFVGHLTATKRPGWFLDLVGRLRAGSRDVRGVLIGDGPLDETLRAAAPPGVVLLGRRADVPELLRAADVLVFPSEPESEGMPGVLIEAGLTGLPVVATRVAGAATVVAHGRTGFVVAHDDFEALVAHATRLVDDRQLRREMGAAAREHCVAHFSQDAVLDGWRTLLSSLAPLPGGVSG